MSKILLSLAILALLIPLTIGASFAQQTFQVRIHSGAADPHSNVFLVPPEPLDIAAYDSVEWGNGDGLPHEIVSGTPDNGPDGIFNSGILQPGQSFTFQFVHQGTFNYYDKLYPFITGQVNVGAVPTGYKIVSGVGQDAGDGKTTFNVQYSSPKDIISTAVNPGQKSVTFTLVGQVNGSSTLILKLPSGLVDVPYVGVWVDHQVISNYQVTSEGGINTLTIPISATTEEVSVVGTTVVPEFGPIAALIFAIAIIATIAFSAKSFKLNHRLG